MCDYIKKITGFLIFLVVMAVGCGVNPGADNPTRQLSYSGRFVRSISAAGGYGTTITLEIGDSLKKMSLSSSSAFLNITTEFTIRSIRTESDFGNPVDVFDLTIDSLTTGGSTVSGRGQSATIELSLLDGNTLKIVSYGGIQGLSDIVGNFTRE